MLNVNYSYAIEHEIDDTVDFETIELAELPDADETSEKLYQDLMTFFNKSAEIAGLDMKLTVNDKNHCELLLTHNESGTTFRLGSDYIGGSRRRMGEMTSAEAAETYVRSRTIGGHILFVRRPWSVNISRGGNNGVLDRIDTTLLVLHEAYRSKFDVSKMSTLVVDLCPRLAKEICCDCAYFSCFGSFEKFIEVFALDDFIENGKPISFDGSSLESGVENPGKLYAKNVLDAIRKRSLRMCTIA